MDKHKRPAVVKTALEVFKREAYKRRPNMQGQAQVIDGDLHIRIERQDTKQVIKQIIAGDTLLYITDPDLCIAVTVERMFEELFIEEPRPVM